MSESNKNTAQELTQAIDEAYSHGYSEELGGNWKGQPHVHQADGVDVAVGGRYYALFPEDDKKVASIVDASKEGVAEEHRVDQVRSRFTPGGVSVSHMMGVNKPLSGQETDGAGVSYSYDDTYDAEGKSVTGAKEDVYDGTGKLAISSANGPKVPVSTWRSVDGVRVNRKGANGEVGAVKLLTGDRALRAQEIMQSRAASRIKSSVEDATATSHDINKEPQLQ